MFFEGNRIDAMRENDFGGHQGTPGSSACQDSALSTGRLRRYVQGVERISGDDTISGSPLHEFLPHEGSAQNDLAKKMGVPVEKIKQRVKELHEFNQCSDSEAAG